MKKSKLLGLFFVFALALAALSGYAVHGCPPVTALAAVREKTQETGLKKVNGKYYYYLADGKTFNKGLLKYEKNGKTVYSYFTEDGSAYTKGYKAVDSGYFINGSGKTARLKFTTGTHYYFCGNAAAFTDGYLKFVHTDGKTYYRYFSKSGREYTGGFKIAYGCYTAKNGVVTAPTNKKAIRLYFQPDGRRYTGGLLTFPDSKGNANTYYFKTNGAAFTGGYMKASGGAVVKKAGDFPVAVTDETAHIYYFRPNGRAFKNGMLYFAGKDGKSNIYYFNSVGHASGKGLIKTTRFYKADRTGEPVAQKKQTYRFYIQNSKRGFYNAFLRFVHTDGKTYSMYFKKDGTAKTSGVKAVSTRYSADANGLIREKSGKSVYAYSFAADGKGTLCRNKWLKLDGVWAYFNDSGARKYKSNAMHTAWSRIKNQSSRTGYYVVVDTKVCRTFIFTGKAGAWKPFRLWKCSPGKPSTPTVKGHYTITAKESYFNTEHNTCYYASQFYGDYLFHSTLYYRGTWKNYDSRLGMQLSHGCVRLKTENAKWFYENIPIGTAVYIY